MTYEFHLAAAYRDQAKQLRIIAEGDRDPKDTAMLKSLAASYEQMDKYLDLYGEHVNQPGLWEFVISNRFEVIDGEHARGAIGADGARQPADSGAKGRGPGGIR